MAEVTIPIPSEKVWVKFTDSAAAATYTPVFMVPKSMTFFSSLDYAKEELMVQDQGAVSIYEIVHNGIKAGGRVKIKWVAKDIKNSAAADTTLYTLHLGLVQNNFTTRAAYGAWVTSNPNAPQLTFMVKMVITIKDGGGSGVNHVLTAPCTCESITPFAAAGEHLELEATYMFPQEWTRT